ncbi:CIA30 family protein [Lentisphaera profundi]|uniref:CIA30 family protein n=1 Tax=Lentisphaera profundi TaxID=1658616 RepID=A0ABY7VYY2_9BACT|nr:CIA30 family protein [Lentisphaera profundi]WDE98989.1 CIA30 family protein [Lentisphaera profundi]
MKNLINIFSLLILGSLSTMATDKKEAQILIDFSTVKIADWSAVNDGVMGGISSGSFSTKDNKGIFSGSLSLENNGGFASIRHQLKTNPMKTSSHIHLRIKGDGRTYQFRVRASNKFDGISYKYDFATVANQWLDISIPIADMKSTFRGRHMPSYTAPKAQDIQQISFLLADKKPGSFKLLIESISHL